MADPIFEGTFEVPGQAMRRPDWVILGLPHNDEVMILASTSLETADLDLKYRRYFTGNSEYHLYHDTYVMKVEMDNFVAVLAATYPEALRYLLTRWTPQPATRALGGVQ